MILPKYKVQEMGLEPTHSHLRQILSLMRLPFRHSCVLNSYSLPYIFQKCKRNFGKSMQISCAAAISFRSQSSQRSQNNPSESLLCGSGGPSRPPEAEALLSEAFHCNYSPWNARVPRYHG